MSNSCVVVCTLLQVRLNPLTSTSTFHLLSASSTYTHRQTRTHRRTCTHTHTHIQTPFPRPDCKRSTPGSNVCFPFSGCWHDESTIQQHTHTRGHTHTHTHTQYTKTKNPHTHTEMLIHTYTHNSHTQAHTIHYNTNPHTPKNADTHINSQQLTQTNAHTRCVHICATLCCDKQSRSRMHQTSLPWNKHRRAYSV